MLVNRRDARTYVLDKLTAIAADDVVALADRHREILAKADHAEERLPHLRDRIVLANDLLRDFANGDAGHIPLHCVAAVAVAVLYLLQDVDAVPDFLPEGLDDDDLILEVAIEIGRPGLERYCASRGLDCCVLDQHGGRPRGSGA